MLGQMDEQDFADLKDIGECGPTIEFIEVLPTVGLVSELQDRGHFSLREVCREA